MIPLSIHSSSSSHPRMEWVIGVRDGSYQVHSADRHCGDYPGPPHAFWLLIFGSTHYKPKRFSEYPKGFLRKLHINNIVWAYYKKNISDKKFLVRHLKFH